MSKVKDGLVKAVKIISIIVSLGFIGLSGVEVVSNYVGSDLSFFGFNLTETQQQVSSYITSGGLATLGGFGIVLNDYVNRKQRESRLLVNTTLEKFLTLQENYEKLETKLLDAKKEIIALKSETTNQLYLVSTELARFNQLIEIDLQAKLSNPLIDTKVQELIKGALENGDK